MSADARKAHRTNTWVRACVILLLLAHAGLLAWSGWRHSPVLNEVGHLPAGISHWKFGRFDLYRVNPPLVRAVAAIPVLLAGPATDWKNYSLNPLVRSETYVSIDFMHANGFRTFWLYALGRWACIPLSLIGAWTCYRWARELHGIAAGLAALTLWCTCPNILGNGSLIMPDVPAAALGATACYAFWRWLKKPTWLRTLVAGAALGVAQLTKMTLVIFFVSWPISWLIDRRLRGGPAPKHSWLREVGMLGAQMLLGLYVINLGYLFEGSFQRLGDYRFQSHTLTGLPSLNRGSEPGNRFAGTWLASLPVPLPKNYVQGIDSQKLDFERGMRSYLRGQWSERGWWYFYLYGLAIKLPLGTWLLVILATWLKFTPGRQVISWRDELPVLAPLVVILLFISLQTGFSLHLRYALPSLPFLFVWASGVVSRRDPRCQENVELSAARTAGSGVTGGELPYPDGKGQGQSRQRSNRILLMITALSLVWSIGSSLWYYPHSLSYFNELVGGPENAHEHLLGSNLDWGQDLLYLKDWYDIHPEARPLHFASYGSIDRHLASLAMKFAPPPEGPNQPGFAGNADQANLGPLPGWFAVDVYHLHNTRGATADQRMPWGMPSRDSLSLSYFGRLRPVDRIGYSIYVYHVTLEEANRVRRDLQLGCLDP